MKISIGRLLTNLATRGRAPASRFAWWSRWFPPAPTVDADRFQTAADPYPDHWKEFPTRWRAGRVVLPSEVKAALAALPDPWQRVVILRDVEGRPDTEVSALTGLSAEQQRDVLNRARELVRRTLGDAFERDPDGNRS